MRKTKSSVWVFIMGMVILGILAGCSSQLETTILSEKAPPEPEVTQAEEEPVAPPPEPVVSEGTIGEQDLDTPPREVPPVVAVPPGEMTLEDPPQAVIRPSSPETAVAIPPSRAPEADKAEEVGETPPMTSAAPVVGGIPPVLFDPEMPPQPTIREGTPGEVAMVEPEPIKVPQRQPAQVESTQREPGLPPHMFDPELPPDPSLREGEPTEIAKLEQEPIKESMREMAVPPGKSVEEKPLEVVKVQPEASGGVVAPGIAFEYLTDIYFDYDQFSLRNEAKETLNYNARLLLEQLSGQKVIIEGHCDERGTESYNMILGKRRAETVKKFLVDLGVPQENLEVVSYGKEKPFCMDHTLDCWQENRRGHFVVR